MEKDFDQIDGIFKNALGNYEEIPSSGAWQNLEQNLGKSTFDFLKNWPKQFLFLGFTAITSLGFLSFFLVSRHGIEQPIELKYTYSAIEHEEIKDFTEKLEAKYPQRPRKRRGFIKVSEELEKQDRLSASSAMQDAQTQPANGKSETGQLYAALVKDMNDNAEVDKEAALGVKEEENIEQLVAMSSEDEDQKREFEDGVTETYEISSKISSFTTTTDTTEQMILALVSESTLDTAFYNKGLPPAKKTAVSIDLFGTPTLESKRLHSNLAEYEGYINKRKEEEKSLVSFLLGAEAKYEVNNHFFQGGINYTEYREASVYKLRLTYSDTSYQPIINSQGDTTGYRPIYSSGSFSVKSPGKSKIKYLDVPLLAGYQYKTKMFDFDAAAGVSVGFVLNTKGQILLPIDSKTASLNSLTKTDGAGPFKSMNLNGLLRLGVAYKVNDQWKIMMRPSVRYSLNSVLKKEYNTGERYFIVGINTGINYKF